MRDPFTPTMRRLYQTVGWLLVTAIVLLSLWPDVATPDVGVEWNDKLGHIGAYLLLMLWFAQLSPRSDHISVAFRLAALGAVIEVLQWLSGYRQFELADMGANLVGIFAGWLLAGTRVGRLL